VALRFPPRSELEATNPGDTVVRFERVQRFRFTPHTNTNLPVFLSLRCGDSAVGCTTVDQDHCTLSVRCEEANSTCGDNGECTAIDVAPQAVSDGGSLDAANDVVTQPLDAIDVIAQPADASTDTEAAVSDAAAPDAQCSPLDAGH
jgi:hypothetical protein